MKIFLISPVAGITEEEKIRIDAYVKTLEDEGHSVHVPYRDTDQTDWETYGYEVCLRNEAAIFRADAVHLWWNPNSRGSLFDLGMTFQLGKPFMLANPEDIEPKEGKCFENMICYWSNLYEHWTDD